MNKTLQRLSGIALVAVISASAGYVAGISRNKSETPETAQTESADMSRRAPRFTLNKRELGLDPEDKKAGLDFNNNSLDAILVRFSRMTPDQLEEEMMRLKDLDLFSRDGMDVKKLISSVYLSYKWGQTSPKQALEQVKKMGPLAMLVSPMVIQGWAETSPEAAAAYFTEHRQELTQAKQALKTIAAEMSRTSPEGAMKWMAGLSDEERKEALPSILSGIAKSHPEQLKNHIGKLTPEDLKDSRLCSELAAGWAATDWDAASRWVDTLEGSQKDQARNSALARLSTLDPEKTTSEFKKLDEKTQESSASAIVSSMAQKDPVQALKWLTENTSEETAAKNANNAIGYMNNKSPELREYAMEMKEGPVKDSVLESLVERTSYDTWNSFVNFEDTLSLTDGIKDQKKKENSISTALRSWSRQDPQKAKNWIEAANLPDSLKKEHLERCETELKSRNK